MPKLQTITGFALLRNAVCGAALAVACGGSGAGDAGPLGQAGSGTSSGAAPSAGSSSTAPGGAASGGSGVIAAGGTGNTAAGATSLGGGTSVAGMNAGGTNAGGASAGGTTSAGGASAGGASTGGKGGAAGSTSVPAGDLWVATDGSNANPGTQALPILDLPNALARIAPGFTIWIKAGTYKYTAAIQIKKAGTAAAPYTISAAPGARPVIDFTGQAFGTRGFDLQGDYWHFVGFDIKNAGDNCILISGSHNTIENLGIHGCQDTGLQITVSTTDVADNTRGAYNTILNCDSYENFDAPTLGENADGFAAKLRVGPGNAFRGCRAYNNSDDGWDFFAADDVITVDGCWSFSNGKGVAGNNPAGDGNGFKLGGKPSGAGEGGAVHVVTASFGFENLACGYTQNSNPLVPKLVNCGAKSNATDYCQTLTKSGSATMTMTAAQAKAVTRNADGSLPPMK